MKMILSNTQFVAWLTNCCELCTVQMGALRGRDPPVVVAELTGEGSHVASAAQMGYPCDMYDSITCLALQALHWLPRAGIDAVMSFAKILQSPAESFL